MLPIHPFEYQARQNGCRIRIAELLARNPSEFDFVQIGKKICTSVVVNLLLGGWRSGWEGRAVLWNVGQIEWQPGKMIHQLFHQYWITLVLKICIRLREVLAYVIFQAEPLFRRCLREQSSRERFGNRRDGIEVVGGGRCLRAFILAAVVVCVRGSLRQNTYGNSHRLRIVLEKLSRSRVHDALDRTARHGAARCDVFGCLRRSCTKRQDEDRESPAIAES